mmetsp:Transcript_34241/g.108813  ORF Transcript_34241/g.108813 Transcript_34241/m.108813 type:complete len:522 (-) Transcript_34241:379-1944(-)
MRCNAPGAVAQAGAGVAAGTPVTPVREDAMHHWLAGDALVAACRDPRGARRWLAAGARLPQDLARAPGGATLAAAGAGLPILPVVPGPIHALVRVAPLRVACLDLLLAQRVAGLPALARSLHDVAVPRPLAAVTLDGAAAPIRPQAPHAVRHVAGARLALLRLLQAQVAAVAAVLRQLQQLAPPVLLTQAASCTASAPIRPGTHLAIDPVAGLAMAALDFHEVRWAWLPAGVRVLDHLPVPGMLATTARLVATVPLRPLGDHAIQRLGAWRHLLQVSLAGLPSTAALAENLALAELLGIFGAAAPLTPVAGLARHDLPWAFLSAARLQLLEVGIARAAAILRQGLDAAPTLLYAALAGLGALPPIAPRMKGASRDRRLRSTARSRLTEHAIALLATIGRHPVDGAAAVPLCGAVLAMAPIVPWGEGAVLHLRAVGRTPFGLGQGPVTGLASQGVHDLDIPRPLAQLSACGLRPLAPGPEDAVHSCIPLLTADSLALCHVKLHPCTSGGARPSEEVVGGLVL